MRLNRLGERLAGVIAASLLVAHAGAATPHAPHYAVVARIAGPGTDWDYESVDGAARRLYLAHSGVTALDLATHKLTSPLVAGKLTHGVLPLGHGRVAVADSGAGTVTFFEGATGKVLATLPIPSTAAKKGFRDPDALALEPKTGLLIAVNGDSSKLILIDPKTPSIVGDIPIGGDLEFAAADGTGRVFVNIASANELAEVDVANRKVVARFPLKGCDEPTGLAFDERANLLISVCTNGVAKFIDATSGRDLKTLKVGEGPDAVFLDPGRRLVFVPSGEAGTLSVISVRSASRISLVQTVPTQLGARTGAVDPVTGRVYLPAAKFGPPTADFPFPRAIEGTFQILVVAPK